ncbi:MAG TPA: SusD/RagB family nutrient-binding outer membrane lipoprotein [Puia sp.]|nr:SusD/RagB family nutrient-binding outer membrane lipoprotein [Puia sp.]
MLKRIRTYITVSASLLLLATAGCKKGTFDINSPNPNTPSSVSPQFLLSSALTASAQSSFAAGFVDFANLWSGYYAFSGDYGGYGTTATYNINNGYANANWDYVYAEILVNYQYIIDNSRTAQEANYFGIGQIMQAFHYQRLVDIYNNIPYTDALKGGVLNYPKYTDAATVYQGIIKQVDSGIAAIKGATANADNPGKYDVMFGGNMSNWILFGNTVKLKILLNLTQWSGGPALIKSELNGLTTSSFLGAGQDAAINPGYSNSANNQLNPTWQNTGFTVGGSDQGDHDFYRANSYAVNWYLNNGDPRAARFYAPNANGVIRGRAYGSQDGTEHNLLISSMGPGILQSPSQSAYILPAFESLFFQAEALQRGYISSSSSLQTVYQTAVQESFRLLYSNVTGASYKDTAAAYYGQPNPKTNFTLTSNPLTFIMTQEWAALNQYDPVTSWNNWKRLGIPSDLPVSIYPGTTAAHAPIRLIYPVSEYTANAANVSAQGNIDVINGKIFWMP